MVSKYIMKKRIISILMVVSILFTSGITSQAISEKDETSNAITNETENNSNDKSYIVKIKSEELPEILASKKYKKIGNDKFLLKVMLSGDEYKKLSENSEVLYIEEDYIVSACSNDRPESEDGSKWNIEAIGANEIQQLGYTGNGVKIAVLDSGIDKWLESNISGSIDFVAEDGEFDTDDLTGHGTAVSSIISFENGIAPGSEMIAVKVLDSQNSSPISRIIEGVDWCIENNIDIINMSFGTENYSIALNEKIQEAIDNDIVIVAAAGNNGDNGRVLYPAKYENVIAVSSIGPDMVRSDFSAIGDELTISAPGEQICALGLFGGESIVSGTSFAAAHVTGAVAVLLEKIPDATPDVICALIKASAIVLGVQREYGSGLIDLSYAMEICDDFYNNYDITDNYNAPANTNTIYDFSDEVIYVNGLWGSSNHDRIINGLPNSTTEDIAFVKSVARLMDDNSSFQGKNFPQIHAHPGQNYVTTARFLYHVVRYYWGLSSNNVMVNKPSYMGDEWITIVTKLYVLFGISIEGRTGNTNIDKGWMALGALAHLVGDIYAHASIVNPEIINSFNQNHFITAVDEGTDIYHPSEDTLQNDIRLQYEHLHTNLYHFVGSSYNNLQIPYQCRCFNCFKRAVSLEAVTCIKIQTFYNTNTTRASLYEDNANFMPERLTKASSYFVTLISSLQSNSTFPMRAMSSADFKLERFVEYACCNGENVSSVRSWNNLSVQINRSNSVCNNVNCDIHSSVGNCLCKGHQTALPGTDTINPLARVNYEHYVNSSSPNCSYTP